MRDNPMTSRRTRIGLAVALALLWTGAGANAKELHWRAIEVAARLESDGTLAVSEVQRMVFTGDWNGGERKFRLGAGQTLTLDRMVRLQPGSDTGTELRRGSLERRPGRLEFRGEALRLCCDSLRFGCPPRTRLDFLERLTKRRSAPGALLLESPPFFSRGMGVGRCRGRGCVHSLDRAAQRDESRGCLAEARRTTSNNC